MATVVWAAGALDALAAAHGGASSDGAAAAGTIASAVALLAAHPLAGPRLRGDLRALVIGHGAAGHVALYRFLPLRQEVRVLAIRGQRALQFRP